MSVTLIHHDLRWTATHAGVSGDTLSVGFPAKLAPWLALGRRVDVAIGPHAVRGRLVGRTEASEATHYALAVPREARELLPTPIGGGACRRAEVRASIPAPQPWVTLTAMEGPAAGRGTLARLVDVSASGLGLTAEWHAEEVLAATQEVTVAHAMPDGSRHLRAARLVHRSLAGSTLRYGLVAVSVAPIQRPDVPFEPLWDCADCGTRELLGHTHRHCPSCGSAQHGATRFPAWEALEPRDAHWACGKERRCPFCLSDHSDLADHCGGCGRPLTPP